MTEHKLTKYLLVMATLAMVCHVAVAEDLKKTDLQGSIVYAGNEAGSYDIWLMRADGSGKVNLTADAFDNSDPVFSPDGDTILYTSLRKGIRQLWTIDRKGKNGKKLCNGCQADWSPDGTSIVFVRDGQVYTRVLATGKETLVSPPMWEQCGFPAWHPQGKGFALSSLHQKVVGVYMIGFGQDKPRRLETRKEACTPRWRPDGTRLLYQTSSNVCWIKPDGKGDEQLTFGGDIQHFARFSPDGKMMVFCRAPAAEGPWRIVVMRLDDEATVTLTDKHSAMYPDWHAK